jgi:O-antigen ligase
MNIINQFLLLCLFTLSLFLISNHFANSPAPTSYIAIGGCCVFAFMVILQRYKQQTLSLSLTEALLGGFLLFSIVYGAYSRSLNPEWIITGVSLGLFYMVVKRINLSIEWLFAGLVVIGISQALYGLGQYMHWFSNIAALNFRMSGSFDNPAGFAAALSVAFPFAFFLVSKKQIYWRIVGGVAAVLFIVAVVLSQSRAGVLSIIVISGIWIIKYLNLKWLNRYNKQTIIVGSGILIIAILVGLYFIKKNSADGRLLIWQCSAKMIADKPLLGHGVGGFQREYMLYQADYFRNHPDSSYSMLADIVKHPFNEFLLLFVEQGLVGALFLGLFLYYLIREYRRSKSNETFYAILCLAGIAMFGCFSYPLGYPFIRLVVVFSLAIVMRNEPKTLEIPRRFFFALKPFLLIICIGLLVINGKMFYDEYHWNAIAKRSLAGETKKVLPDYARLYKTMNKNGLFLYNYGSELNFIGEWNKSTVILNECANFYNDIDLQLQLADNYTQLKQYHDAEKCFLLAHQMIPNRFIPLYRLALLYKEEGKIHEAHKIAEIIVKKQVKVESIDIMAIKEGMNKLILSN